MEYKNTLNLPKTEFPIKFNHQKQAPDILAFWKDMDVYQRMLKANAGKSKFVLHDGPPYPNGDIHLGHALNKILKDIIVKYKAMTGHETPYVPGWDCHGLPIETQMIKELGVKRKMTTVAEFRSKCREYALNYVNVQKDEFKTLGVLADWENPYLTLQNKYEKGVVELFGILAEKGYIYRGLKPIHWCPICETALAEAEIEYEDEVSKTVFVRFDMNFLPIDKCVPAQQKLEKSAGHHNISFIIWTTTPWTLPANVAIAANPDVDYALVSAGDRHYILASALVNKIMEKLGISGFKIVDEYKGKDLEGIEYKHPFMVRTGKVVLDHYVTVEDGTGLVHIAPGHGEEDHAVGLKYKLPIIMPVDERGFFTKEAGKYEGKKYSEANDLIIEDMRAEGHLLNTEPIKHSYPHCWRCKKPVIFRATEQWFISVDHNKLREEALKAITGTKWFPAWGENRIRGMVTQRPDWCISRQRTWGVPIPAFYCKKCGVVHYKGDFNKAIVKLFETSGSDSWFTKDASEILHGLKCSCGSTEFEKETDILDVWFESGASHYSVLWGEKELSWPADLYLEGSDQHRGWFQTSLLTSIAAKGKAPFNSVLTHGFTVDENGKKMSKSLGNVVDPLKVIQENGADVLRLWVASTDFRNDMGVSKSIIKQVSDAFSKIRNTCRFMLSNLNGFDTAHDLVKYETLDEIDKWALLRLQRLIEKVRTAYETYELHMVFHSIHEYCVTDLSSLYFDIIKDRLYCSEGAGTLRRSSQTVMAEILTSLVKLYAPVLSFTAEDIWKYMNGTGMFATSIFEAGMAEVNKKYLDEKLEIKWTRLLEIRGEVYKQIELLRAEKTIGHPLEARVEVTVDGDDYEILKSLEGQLSAIHIVSEFVVNKGKMSIIVKKAEGKKCERCWMYLHSVGKHSDHPTLCDRCAEVVKKIPA